MAAMPGLAEEVIHINGRFILAKINIKCSLISVHHGGRHVAGGSSGAFDEFIGTFGLPFERRIDTTTANSEQPSPVLRHLESLSSTYMNDVAAVDEEAEWLVRRCERTLVNLSSSIATFTTPPLEQWPLLRNSEVLRQWRGATYSDFLYVHGGINMTETSKQLFYLLDQQAIHGRGHEPVLYFSFDKHDTTRNTLKDMLATFLGQMICHKAGIFRSWVPLLFAQMNEEHSWTDQDLLQWFSDYSSILFTMSAFLVIDRFDECPKAGRDSFVEFLHRRTASEETAWKVAVTSRTAVNLPQGLQGWRHIDLAVVMASDECLDTDIQVMNTTKLKKILSRNRPELLNDDAWVQSINQISSGDILTQSIILEHLMSIPEWPRKLSVEEAFNFVEKEDSGDELVIKILDSIFRKLADRFPVQTMPKWLLYSARPLSVWEFTSVMYPESLDNSHASPDPESVQEFVHLCESRFRGVIEIRDTTVRLRDPRLRALLTRTPSVSSAYLWNDIDATQAAHDITKACLQFLSRPNVQQELESIFEQAALEEHKYGPVSGCTNFCSYAAYSWPRHAAFVPAEMGLSSLMDEFEQTAMSAVWLKSYWCLENPATRTKQPAESVDTLLAGLGLSHSDIGTWDSRSISFATERAAAQGQREMVETLLYRCEQSNSTLMDALIAAASSGQEELVLHIFGRIKNTKSAGSETFKWPPCLLFRAVWLGMDKFARALLEDGCSPDPGGPMAGKPRVSPLFQATGHGHTATMEALLSHGADMSFTTVYNRSIICRILLENGARPDITGRIGDSVWSLRDVAIFNKINRCCLQLVEDALVSITVQPVVLPETMNSKKGRTGALMKYICHGCYYDLRGSDYICPKCSMHLCNKCHWHRDLIHEPLCESTEWEQKGPEFEEEQVPVEPESKGETDESGDEDEDSSCSLSSLAVKGHGVCESVNIPTGTTI
ncbi:hypothetical protein INS49_009560 [Diaporthe citri]|uniref:uncharacterized protein n=1 Tax=Diaporthe citri TaxID=83186 RepID=UPI001C7F0BB5|nr:uncharacterized protein INS49_009560 [Diaporthe citri]KAG6361335.1 hypothetical protein INS49_009560 [Diaporthe citri]